MPTRPSDEYSIRFYLAAPDCAEYYRPEWLDEADRIRLLHHPARAAQTGWRVSRFLKRRAGVFSDGLFSLSHSGGHAVLAVPSVLPWAWIWSGCGNAVSMPGRIGCCMKMRRVGCNGIPNCPIVMRCGR